MDPHRGHARPDAGTVDGTGELVEVLSCDVELVRMGRTVLAFNATQPGVASLDLKVPELIDGSLRSRFGLKIAEAPACDTRRMPPAVKGRA